MKPIKRSSSLAASKLERLTNDDVAEVAAVKLERGYVDRKSSTRQRAHSVAAQILGKAVQSTSAPVLKISVTTTCDKCVKVSLETARPEGRGLPVVCRVGATSVATLLAPRSLPCKALKGEIEIDGFKELVPFAVGRSGDADSWAGVKGHWKHTALHTASWDWKGAPMDKPTEGEAADIVLANGELKINLRAQTVMELKRSLQLQALREATVQDDYDTLRAQVTKAKMASVDNEEILVGEARLKGMRELGLHVNEGCDRASIRQAMNWTLVTGQLGAPCVNEVCTICEDCPCNVSQNQGEVLEVVNGHVQEILKGFGPDSDKVFFESLVDAALTAEEGTMWKAGGKYIFSEFNRNQSALALERMLLKFNKDRCAKMLMELHKYTETKYNGFVTAVQVNFHPSGSSFHDQHRDIYSLKQSAGPNCTCNFQECVGTVCYSLGSSRVCLCETMTDNLSKISPCGDDCEGRSEYNWLHSGTSMYFNGDWNDNHTHGIPPCEEKSGPRISLAFLLAAKPSNCMFVYK